MKAKFHIPDIWVHKDLNLYLIDMIKNHPEFFYDDIEIASCYGCFPSALWNVQYCDAPIRTPSRTK